MPIVALVSRACRRSHEYSGDPFDPRRLLTVALYDNCSSQIALSCSSVRGRRFGTWLTARPGTRRPVDASDQSSGQPPRTQRKLASTRRRPTRISNRAHAPPEKFDYSRAVPHVSAYQQHSPAASTTTSKASSAAPPRKFAAATAGFGNICVRPRRAPDDASAPPSTYSVTGRQLGL